MKKAKITLDDLARMTAKGFENIDKRFDTVDKRFGKTDSRIDNIEQKMERGFSNVNARLDMIERDVRDIRAKLSINISHEEYLEIDERLTIIEEKMKIKY